MSSRNALRRVLLASAALMALPGIALAQSSRVEGMDMPGDYIKDWTGIYTYVSGVASVGNLVYGELGQIGLTNSNTTAVDPTNSGYPLTKDRSVGAVIGNLFDGGMGTWAIHLREETPALGQADNFSQPNPGAAGFDPNENQNESFDLMWGKKFGTTSLGLRLNRSFFKAKVEPIAGAETNLEFDPNAFQPNIGRNIWGFGGGVGFEMNANTNLEVSVLFQNRTFENTVAGTTVEQDDGGTTYQLAARAMYQWQPNVMLVPVFKYYSFDLSSKTDGPPPASFENSLKGWQLGMAGNWTVGNNDLFVLGLMLAQNTVDQETAIFQAPVPTPGKATETIMPQVFAALETHVNNWLTLRFGARKDAYNKVKLEPDAGGSAEVTSSPFSMHIGAGVKLGTLQLDTVLHDDFANNLGWIGSGIPNSYFTKVTATYSF
jgi:hypothetical protein